MSETVSRLQFKERELVLFYCNLIGFNSKHNWVRGFDDSYSRLNQFVSDSNSVYVKKQGYKAMISGLCEMGRAREAEDLIGEMRERGLKPTLFEFRCVLYGYGRLGLFKDMERILDKMESGEIEVDTVCANMVLASYGAHNALPEMGLWLRKMKTLGIPLSIRTCNSVLNSCPTIMALMRNLDASYPVSIQELLKILSEEEAMLVKELTESSVLKEATKWDTSEGKLDLHGMHLGSAYVMMLQWMEETRNRLSDGEHNGDVARAIEYFERMPERDAASLSALVSGLIRNGELDEAARVLVRFERDGGRKENLLQAYNTLIAGYGRRDRVDEARKLFDQIRFCDGKGKGGDGRFGRNVVSWNTMIMCYVKAGNIVSARELFDQMMERDTISWNTMISGYVNMLDMDEASRLFCEMPNPDIYSWNKMIAGHAQIGDLDRVNDLFRRMPQKNLVSWNSVITGYEKNYEYIGAIKIFIQMQVEGEKPDRHTLSSVLSVSAAIVDLQLGMQIHQLVTKTVIPDMPINNALITMYSRCGAIIEAGKLFDELEQALDLTNSMPFEPNKAVWGALLGAAKVHNKIEVARVAAEALIRLEPDSSGPYVLLYNMYADVGQWDSASEVRIMMERSNVKKQAAYSWVDSSHW
ncbi:hypothetical protein D5086_018672 [Populus alba]|uniref:Uncharacterized protein n=1 Tax=Populus alba TaxID=43335 RepID=A0ACC4BRQ8_POPAL